MVLGNSRRLGAYKWCWGNLETWCLQMVLSKLGDLVPTNGAKQKSETWCLLMVLSKMNPSTASTMRSMIAEGFIVWRWLWVLARVCDSYVSARTCLGCECLNVCSYGKSKPYGWLAQVYIVGCEWPSELQNSAVQIPGVMGYCGKYAQIWTRTSIDVVEPTGVYVQAQEVSMQIV